MIQNPFLTLPDVFFYCEGLWAKILHFLCGQRDPGFQHEFSCLSLEPSWIFKHHTSRGGFTNLFLRKFHVEPENDVLKEASARIEVFEHVSWKFVDLAWRETQKISAPKMGCFATFPPPPPKKKAAGESVFSHLLLKTGRTENFLNKKTQHFSGLKARTHEGHIAGMVQRLTNRPLPRRKAWGVPCLGLTKAT